MAGGLRPLPASGDNPALVAFKLATIAGLLVLALRNAGALGAAIGAALSILGNMFRLVTGGRLAGAGAGPK